MSRTISLDADILDFINYQKNYVGVEDVQDSKFQRIKKIQNYEAKRLSKVEAFVEKIKIARASVSFILCGLLYTFLTFYFYQIGKIDLSDAIYSITASYEALALVEIVQEVIIDIFSDACSIKQGLEALNKGKMVEDKVSGGENLICQPASIDFENVDFSYEDNNLFHNLNLHIKSGEKIGLSGRSGAGKTSLISLVLRNLYVNNGKILIGGQDISFVDEISLKDKISVVSQDTSLFNRSVLENIRYSKPNATMEEIIEILIDANH